MKVKFKYNRRYSMIITLSACACSLWLMMNNFHFPAEEVLSIAAVCFMLIVPLLMMAAIIGFALRKISDRKISWVLQQDNASTAALNKEFSGEENLSPGENTNKESAISESETNPTTPMEPDNQQANTDHATIKKTEETNHS